MLLKWCVILILSLDFFLCDAEEYERKNSTNSGTVNSTKLVCTSINATRKLRRNGDKEKFTMHPILLVPNATANRVKIEGHEKRYLKKHFAVTCDGYILEIFRLTFEQNKAHTKHCPVLLVTGMFQSSDRFLQQSEDQSLAFTLQDQGYDVWLGNARGNKYSRHHLYLEPESEDKTDFFNYSYEEIGFYDISAIVDFIRNATDFKKIHYIGHSLGGTAFLVLNSLKPEYNAFFDRAYLLAPFAYQRYFPHNDLKRESYHLEKTYNELLKAGTVELFPFSSTDETEKFIPENCLGDQKYEKICNMLGIQKIMGLSRLNNTWDDTRGGSIKQLIHLAQNIHSGTFSRWFYKEEKDNEKNYGRKSPPEYDLSSVTVPTTIFYSAADEFVARRDIEALAKKMGKATTIKVKKRNFKHDDFINAPDVVLHVYSGILNALPENPNPIPFDTMYISRTATAQTPFKFIPTGLMLIIGVSAIIFCIVAALPVADTDPSDGPLASDRDLFIDDDGSGLEIDESSGSGWGPGPGPDDEDGRGSGDRAPFDDEDYTPRTIPTTTTQAPEPVSETTVEPEYVAPRVLDEKPSPGADTPRGAGEDQPSRPETDISISGEDVNPATDQDPSGSNVGAESRPQDNVVFIMNAKPEDRATSFFAQPGILAAVIGGAVVGLLCAILVVMFIVYRMRKKDEGSYALDEPKRSPAAASYGKGQNNREFYA